MRAAIFILIGSSLLVGKVPLDKIQMAFAEKSSLLAAVLPAEIGMSGASLLRSSDEDSFRAGALKTFLGRLFLRVRLKKMTLLGGLPF